MASKWRQTQQLRCTNLRLQFIMKLKQSHYRAGLAQMVPGGWGSQIQYSKHIKVVSLSALRTGRLYLPGNISGTHYGDRFPVVSLGICSVTPPTEPCALRSTQPLKVSNMDFSWGKGGRCVWLTTYHHCSAETSIKSGTLTYPEPFGSPRPVAGWPLLCLTHYS